MATPLNEIVRRTTSEYLSELDTKNPPTPVTIETDLLERTNAAITAENLASGNRGSDKLHSIKTLTFGQVADIMAALHNICRIAPAGKNTDSDYDLLAMYMASGPDEGIYVTSDETFRAIARRYNYSMTTSEFREVIAALKDAAPRKYITKAPNLVAVNNGIFDYDTKTLGPFDPDIILLSKSHVDYVPGAISPVIDTPDGDTWEVEGWMNSLSDDPEVVELLWEIIGAIVRPNVRWNKAAFFYSERGNNGKGTLCELMRNVAGPTSYASIPLADFGKDFLLEPLTRASCVIVDENDVGVFIDRAANLKAVITNDVISINRKFKSPIAYQFHGFMVQCLNDFPRIKDKSESFYRRQLFVPFEKNFTGIERRYIKNEYLHRDDVLQYVLHRVLHMDYYVLSEPDSVKNALENFKENNDPVRAFWNEFEDQFVWDLLPFSFLYDLYRSWFAKTNPSGAPVGRNAFINDLLNIVHSSPAWYCADKSSKVRHNDKKMAQPETLIARYELADWTNPAYHGRDPAQKSRPILSQAYRGLLRHASGPAMLATGTDDSIGLDDDEQPRDRE